MASQYRAVSIPHGSAAGVVSSGDLQSDHDRNYAIQIQPDTRHKIPIQSRIPPSTPKKGSRTRRQNHTKSQGSVDGGVTLAPSPKLVAVQGRWKLQPSSPCKIANISVRRSQHNSTLLHSPARAGYSICMKQIFEDASHSYCAQDGTAVLYPQLPNINRAASSSPGHDIASQPNTAYVTTTHRAGSTLPLTVPLSTTPQKQYPPSESWTHDSEYLETNSHGGASTLNVSSKERVYDWLSKVPQSQDGDADNFDIHPTSPPLPNHGSENSLVVRRSQEMQVQSDPFFYDSCDKGMTSRSEWQVRQEHSRMPSWEIHSPKLVPNACKRLDFGQPLRMNRDANDRPANTPSLTSSKQTPYKEITTSSLSGCINLEEGGIELNSLSPNVCTERGPARHHVNRKRNNTASPKTSIQESSLIRKEAARMKENLTSRGPDIARFDSPLALHYGRVGTRLGKALQDENVPSR